MTSSSQSVSLDSALEQRFQEESVGESGLLVGWNDSDSKAWAAFAIPTPSNPDAGELLVVPHRAALTVNSTPAPGQGPDTDWVAGHAEQVFAPC
jgi:hypothetical protein